MDHTKQIADSLKVLTYDEMMDLCQAWMSSIHDWSGNGIEPTAEALASTLSDWAEQHMGDDEPEPLRQVS